MKSNEYAKIVFEEPPVSTKIRGRKVGVVATVVDAAIENPGMWIRFSEAKNSYRPLPRQVRGVRWERAYRKVTLENGESIYRAYARFLGSPNGRISDQPFTGEDRRELVQAV